eukprot:CAMPEP_0206379998 /NCGR_PEP_ID=MMETSP0294-20121207/11742_1 /ASSEMBLY_ACC=CAM_ASM_000327 /TAXON_ID=39354 /ORGANISM="Heterosigma akashiwo, Strain CCMP2393" /LENGTH=96 /DNA_ID=CAMNT_0053829083 /DNA_START=286 /DNA_END=576 /DNA_ORIENTATION=+
MARNMILHQVYYASLAEMPLPYPSSWFAWPDDSVTGRYTPEVSEGPKNSSLHSDPPFIGGLLMKHTNHHETNVNANDFDVLSEKEELYWLEALLEL